jgi:hypothetical protein
VKAYSSQTDTAASTHTHTTSSQQQQHLHLGCCSYIPRWECQKGLPPPQLVVLLLCYC